MPCYHPMRIVHPTRRKWKREGYIPNTYEAQLIPSFLSVPCGRCVQCLRRRARDWKVRIMAEHARYKYRGCRFVTLTFSDSELSPFWVGEGDFRHSQRFEDYDIALIVRRFLERIRKLTGKSVRHVFIPEFGSSPDGTHRLHLHGILFGCFLEVATLEKVWKHGFIHVHSYCDARTSGYITKYMTKDLATKTPVFVSAGIGSNLVTATLRRKFERYLRSLKEDLRLDFNGFLYGMPLYVYNKISDWFERFSISLRRNPLEFAGLEWPDASALEDYRSYLRSIHSPPCFRLKPDIRHIPLVSFEFEF